MAISTVKEKVILKLELDNGVVEGKQKIKSKSFNGINTDATDEALHGTGIILADLQKNDLLKVKRVEELTLVEE
ncbi:MAG: DUF1659 domain-containing protein [Tissierellaceae bacterium]